MGSVTVGAGAAAGVFERESDLMAENRSAMSTQARPAAWQRAAYQAPRPVVRAGETCCTGCPPSGRATARRMCQGVRGSPALRRTPAPQELTRHAANLGMLAAATVNPARSKHFYLGFQAEHKLAASSARPRALPRRREAPHACRLPCALLAGSWRHPGRVAAGAPRRQPCLALEARAGTAPAGAPS